MYAQDEYYEIANLAHPLEMMHFEKLEDTVESLTLVLQSQTDPTSLVRIVFRATLVYRVA